MFAHSAHAHKHYPIRHTYTCIHIYMLLYILPVCHLHTRWACSHLPNNRADYEQYIQLCPWTLALPIIEHFYKLSCTAQLRSHRNVMPDTCCLTDIWLYMYMYVKTVSIGNHSIFELSHYHIIWNRYVHVHGWHTQISHNHSFCKRKCVAFRLRQPPLIPVSTAIWTSRTVRVRWNRF